MKHQYKKIGKGVYQYRGVLIVFDETQSELCWYIEVNSQRENFRLRTEAGRQVDRYHHGLSELAAAPTNLQLAKTDLTDYLNPDLLLDLQRRLAQQGLGRSIDQLTQAARNGSDGPAKRLMLSLILSRLLAI